MNVYAPAITEATGVTDPADIAEIYGEMGDANHTLNGLSRERIREEARTAWALIQYLRSPEGVAYVATLEAEMAA